jgi:DNA-binding CsgD family transcriptional regulator
MFHDPQKPRETTRAIAEHLQISPATVRWHKAEAAKSPHLRKVLGLA